MTVPARHIDVRPSWRVIPSRFPPIALFERVADPADFEALYELESRTNPRLRDETGDLTLVPPEDRVSGPGYSYIMAAFTHLNPAGSRFSDGSYGVYYAGGDLLTAVAETRYHRENFLRATREAPIDTTMRAIAADIVIELHDLRGLRVQHPDLYARDDYSAGQALARRLRGKGSNGIAYDSVRREGGECFAVFRPRCLSAVRQERHLTYMWDGKAVITVYEKTLLAV